MSGDHITRLRDTEASTRLCGGSLPHVTLSDLQAILAERDGLREALTPFAEAAENLDDGARDTDHCWESPAAMTVTAGDFRKAAATLTRRPDAGDAQP